MVPEALRLAWLGAERGVLRRTVSTYEDPQPAETKTGDDP